MHNIKYVSSALTIRNPAFLPHSALIRSVIYSQYTAVSSLNRVNWLVFVVCVCVCVLLK
jgi:hypothetical protein